MLALVRGDMGDGSENVRAMSRGALNAVTVVDAALSGLVIDIEVLEVIVEVDGARAKIAAEEGRVGGKDGGDIDVPLATEGDGEPRLPLVEVGDHGAVELARDVL